uniref:Uncharacterized protein n=1 Tax=Setaria digitata TaxID=48799 RepID=A0A915PZ57_9BILA
MACGLNCLGNGLAVSSDKQPSAPTTGLKLKSRFISEEQFQLDPYNHPSPSVSHIVRRCLLIEGISELIFDVT